MNDRRALVDATAGLRNNLCDFPAMFAKSVMVFAADGFHTATATLVDLGQGPLAVTCAHVITPFRELWEGGKAMIRINNSHVSPSQLVGLDTDVDLATIRLSEEQAAALVSEDGIATQFYTPTRWPPTPPAQTGEFVALGGFPALWRQKRSETREVIMSYYGIGATPVTSAHDRLFTCQFEREYWIWVSRTAELADLTMLNGLSGGPVFVERHLHRALIGIVTDFREDGDIMLMAHTHWIQKDGSISMAERPWLTRRETNS